MFMECETGAFVSFISPTPLMMIVALANPFTVPDQPLARETRRVPVIAGHKSADTNGAQSQEVRAMPPTDPRELPPPDQIPEPATPTHPDRAPTRQTSRDHPG